MLIGVGANVMISTEAGLNGTALHYAAGKGHLECVRCCKYTHGHNIPHSWFSEKHFNSFDSLPIGIKKQMISHLKALVKSFENQE